MRFIGRLLLLPIGLIFAIPAGMCVLAAAAVFDPVAFHFAQALLWSEAAAIGRSIEEGGSGLVWYSASGIGPATSLMVAPPVFVALVGEVAGWRSLTWYGGATGAITAALPWLTREAGGSASAGEGHLTVLLFVTGAGAGLVYWLIAGSSAGHPRPVSGPASSGS